MVYSFIECKSVSIVLVLNIGYYIKYHNITIPLNLPFVTNRKGINPPYTVIYYQTKFYENY